jgi:hypothetical protein
MRMSCVMRRGRVGAAHVPLYTAYGMPRWVAGRVLNCGQSCVGAKRFIVLDKVHDQFVEVSGTYRIIACRNVV